MNDAALYAGRQLRALRERLGLTLRDVESASNRLADKRGNEGFAIGLSRLSDIESKGVLPSLYWLYSLAVIYRRDLRELLAWYGIEVDDIVSDLGVAEPPRSHRTDAVLAAATIRIPVKLDPAFKLQKTTNLGRMIERWGVVPLAYLAQFENSPYSFGYIGYEDFTMYPILLPGTLVQIDETRNQVKAQMWHSEYERPIYFVETRDEYVCSWCTLNGSELVLQPHPLSPDRARVFRHPQDAEILGQVVGIAMRLDVFSARPAERPKLAKST